MGNGVNHDPADTNHDQHLEENEVTDKHIHSGHCDSDCNGNVTSFNPYVILQLYINCWT